MNGTYQDLCYGITPSNKDDRKLSHMRTTQRRDPVRNYTVEHPLKNIFSFFVFFQIIVTWATPIYNHVQYIDTVLLSLPWQVWKSTVNYFLFVCHHGRKHSWKIPDETGIISSFSAHNKANVSSICVLLCFCLFLSNRKWCQYKYRVNII